MKKLSDYCKWLMWGTVVAYACSAIYAFVYYLTHQDIYAMRSAPWYAELIIPGVLVVLVLIVLTIVRTILKKKEK